MNAAQAADRNDKIEIEPAFESRTRTPATADRAHSTQLSRSLHLLDRTHSTALLPVMMTTPCSRRFAD